MGSIDKSAATSLQAIKSSLERRGPDSVFVRAALKAYGRLHGFKVRFTEDRISIKHGERDMILSSTYYVQVPIMMECYNLFFDTVASVDADHGEVLDFSRPGVHKYKRSGIAFHFPSVPEDDAIQAYTHWYVPRLGDVVWDVGAHAGATTYFFSRFVGPEGRVYAFEPDDRNYEYLLRNIAMHQMTNVVPVKKALADHTGTTTFHMDGTMNAGIAEYLVYKETGRDHVVPTIDVADACEEFGSVPAFIKMDIEGAEVAVVRGAESFLKRHPIHFAIETYHRLNYEYTYKTLERLFPAIGYEVMSSNQWGQMFTWARPKVEAIRLERTESDHSEEQNQFAT
jgi:FkbM family methyltransferase